MPLFSCLEVKGLTFSYFDVLNKTIYISVGVKITKELYLSHLTSNQENKGTLFPSTLKDGEKSALIFLIKGQMAEI